MKRLCFTLLGLVVLACPLLFSSAVHADVNDFIITRFDADYTLSSRDRQGEMRIVEDIHVDFSDNNHGILRALPKTYHGHRLQPHINSVSSPSGAPASYTTSTVNKNLVLKIGDSHRTVTGPQVYRIDYTVRNVISFYKGHDELYWDINGDEWSQPAWLVKATIHTPKDSKFIADPPLCYAGAYGSKEQACQVFYAGTSDKIAAVTTSQLSAAQTLSVVVGFEPGYFQPSSFLETVNEYRAEMLSFLVPFVLLAGSAGWLWFLKGRDPKGRGTIVPEYDAPDNLMPLDVGTLIDFKTDNRDITATIIDLAVRGYITIIEEKKERKFKKDTKVYRLRLRKADTTGLDAREKALLLELFGTLENGAEVSLSDKAYKLSKAAEQLRKDTKKSLVTGGYINPRFSSLAGVGIAGLITFVLIFGYIALSVGEGHGFVVFGLLAGMVVACGFLAALPSRTAKGVAAKEHMKGLKLYLTTAEADRLKMLQSPSSPYVPEGNEPQHTVHLFEKLLPYAIVLGVEEEWAKQFTHLYDSPPDWYSGNMAGFNTAYLVSSLGSGVQSSVNSAFSAPRSSSSSGFGGGGFSGGGGGGGGGGGW